MDVSQNKKEGEIRLGKNKNNNRRRSDENII